MKNQDERRKKYKEEVNKENLKKANKLYIAREERKNRVMRKERIDEYKRKKQMEEIKERMKKLMICKEKKN